MSPTFHFDEHFSKRAMKVLFDLQVEQGQQYKEVGGLPAGHEELGGLPAGHEATAEIGAEASSLAAEDAAAAAAHENQVEEESKNVGACHRR